MMDGHVPLRSLDVLDPPCVLDISSAEYHAGPGVSKSNLDLIAKEPALLEWAREAPIDPDAKPAVLSGTAFHMLLLEPESFAANYVTDFEEPADAISTVDGLKLALDYREIPYKASAGKAALTRLLLDADENAPVVDALRAEWERGVNGRTVLTVSESRALTLMRDSVMAHPMARRLIEASGVVERSHYWIDVETGELCRCRMDKEILSLDAIVDVKITSDIGRFNESVVNYRYYVQDSWYRWGYTETLRGSKPSFVFLVVSSTRDRARYPVRLLSLPDTARKAGAEEMRVDLNTFAQCRRSGVWPGIGTIEMPYRFLAKYGAAA